MTVYEPDDQALHVIPRSVTVTALPENQMKEAVTQMIALDQKQKYPVLPKGLTVHSVTVHDGTADVDFSKELKKYPGREHFRRSSDCNDCQYPDRIS